MRITRFKRGVLLAVVVVCSAGHFAAEEPVQIIASQRTEVRTPSGVAVVPLDISLDWSKPQPGVTRAVILLHGKGRDVDGYYRGLLRAAREAGKGATGSILIAPQFLNEDDVKAHALPKEVVRWRTGAWEAGGPAVGPAGISAYEVLDEFLLRLADRTLFPDLRTLCWQAIRVGARRCSDTPSWGRPQPRSPRRVFICGSSLRTRLRTCILVTTDPARIASDAVGGIDGGMGHAALRSI